MVKVDSEVEAGQIVRNNLNVQIFVMRSRRIVQGRNSREVVNKIVKLGY